jgi:hypothetical protein
MNLNNYTKLFASILTVALLFSNCKPDDKVDKNTTIEAEKTPFVKGSQEYNSSLKEIDAEKDTFQIDTFFINSKFLNVVVSYSACTKHQFEIVWDGISTSKRYNILIHDLSSKENCEINYVDTLRIEKSNFDLNLKVLQFTYGFGKKLTVSAGANPPNSPNISVKSGFKLKDCTADCYQEQLASSTLTQIYSDTQYILQQTTMSDDWDDVETLFDSEVFFALPLNNVCSACTDQSYEWIEVTTSKGKHEIRFPFNDTITSIAPFQSALKKYYSALKE